MKSLYISFVLIILINLVAVGCSAMQTSTPESYTIYYNNPAVSRAVQPWPLEEKAEKKFNFVSPEINSLFDAGTIQDGTPEENQLFNPAGTKLSGLIRLEREELIVAIVSTHLKSVIYLDKKLGAWRNGYRISVSTDLVKKIIDELQEEQKRFSIRKVN